MLSVHVFLIIDVVSISVISIIVGILQSLKLWCISIVSHQTCWCAMCRVRYTICRSPLGNFWNSKGFLGPSFETNMTAHRIQNMTTVRYRTTVGSQACWTLLHGSSAWTVSRCLVWVAHAYLVLQSLMLLASPKNLPRPFFNVSCRLSRKGKTQHDPACRSILASETDWGLMNHSPT